jgi:hypothetical protein
MPFRSESQRKWMYANHPEMATRWQEHTPKGKKLPEHVGKVKKAFWAGLSNELQKLAEDNDTLLEAAKRFGSTGASLGGALLLPDYASRFYRQLVGIRESLGASPVTSSDYNQLKGLMGIDVNLPWYRSNGSAAAFVAGPVPKEELKNFLDQRYTDQAIGNLAGQTSKRRIIGSPHFPENVVHELGHAKLHSSRAGQRLMQLSRPLRKYGPIGGALMAGLGDDDSNVVKYAPLATALSQAPLLVDEGLASYRGMKALKQLGKYSPELISQMRKSLLKAFGTYGIRSTAATLPIALVSYLRSRASSGKTDDGAESAQASE